MKGQVLTESLGRKKQRRAQHAVVKLCMRTEPSGLQEKLSSRPASGASLRARYLKRKYRSKRKSNAKVPGGHVQWRSACRCKRTKQEQMEYLRRLRVQLRLEACGQGQELRHKRGRAPSKQGVPAKSGLPSGQGESKSRLQECSLNHPTIGLSSWRLCLKAASLRLAKG